MKYNELGTTGIKVSELCFGALPIGPLQANLSSDEGGTLIRQALEGGVNFIDTAELYGTYEHIVKGIEGFSGELVITSKSLAKEYKDMEKAIQEALRSMKREYLDVFHMHAARAGLEVFEEREGAFQCMLDYKEKGYIRAVGIATHRVDVTDRVAVIPEIDVVHPLINMAGRGLLNGSVEEMVAAIGKCQKAGKGVYAMKALAGGNLLREIYDAFTFVREIPGMNAAAVGMLKKEEVDINLKIFHGEITSAEMVPEVLTTKKIYIWDFICKKCGLCIEACPNHAISMGETVAVVDHELCILCGYCAPACPEFAIRMI